MKHDRLGDILEGLKKPYMTQRINELKLETLDKYAKNNHDHRARLQNVELSEVSIAELYKRGQGKCYLCGKPIQREAATIEHVVPISRGGPHTYANTQIACRFCNGSKLDRSLDVFFRKRRSYMVWKTYVEAKAKHKKWG